jgi:MarR family transcriptional regulator, organic hydroperoxide resistance regulator
MDKPDCSAAAISAHYAAAYYHCHPRYTESLSHQAVRALHFVAMEEPATVGSVAKHLGVAPNTASEVVRRLLDKGLLRRQRHEDDERAVALSLTDAGTLTLREHVGLNVAKLERCLAALPERERLQIAEGVLLLHQRLEEMDA